MLFKVFSIGISLNKAVCLSLITPSFVHIFHVVSESFSLVIMAFQQDAVRRSRLIAALVCRGLAHGELTHTARSNIAVRKHSRLLQHSPDPRRADGPNVCIKHHECQPPITPAVSRRSPARQWHFTLRQLGERIANPTSVETILPGATVAHPNGSSWPTSKRPRSKGRFRTSPSVYSGLALPAPAALRLTSE